MADSPTAGEIANRTILLVEDDIDIAHSIQDLLQEQAIQTTHASNGREAIKALQAAIQLPRMILLDLMMPGMTGSEFRNWQLSLAQFASIPTVIMSADPGATDSSVDRIIEVVLKYVDRS